MKLAHDEIDLCWLTAAHTAAMVPGLLLKDFKNWSDRGLVHWRGEQLKVYQKRLYGLRSVIEAYALYSAQNADIPLTPHGVKFAEVMVKRLRHHHDRGVEFLLGTDEDWQSVLVYAFGEKDGEFKMAVRYALANETVGDLMRVLPLWNFSWELRLFPVDYALAKLLDDYLSHRRHNIAEWERSLFAAAGFGDGDNDKATTSPAV